ncbi:hypothetical protein [Herbiconiux solani]|uniref:hypothetical protein n=1 Tax=Herbiconiux solani TaxID=661329 RepID=UPI00082557E9|nr:hypothetical protein [Herbiconiux solani]
MARMTNDELSAQVERLRAENAVLKAEAASRAETVVIEGPSAVGSSVTPARPRRRRGRTIASVALVVVGLILVPLGLVGNWAEGQLTDTEKFVATFAPLAADPAVKAFVVTEVMDAVDQQVDFTGTTSAAIDAVNGLGVPDTAAAALDALKGPAALGLRSLATGVVTDFVDSPAFEDIWAQTLRVSHRQLIAALTGDPSSALAISSSGELSIQLGPIVEAVKQAMIAQGLDFADAIPAVDLSIVVAQSDGLGQATLGYALAVAVGGWLPWVAFLLLAAGVLLAKRRLVALFGTALALGILMVLVGIALRIGNLVTVASIAPRYLPIDAAGAIYDQVTSLIAATVVSIAVLAFTVAVVAWAAGPLRPAPALRSLFGEGATRLRRLGDARGVTTGAFGRFLGRQRTLVEAAIAVLAALFVLLVRPITVGQTVWTAVIAVVLILLVEILQRPAEETSGASPDATSEAAPDAALGTTSDAPETARTT